MYFTSSCVFSLLIGILSAEPLVCIDDDCLANNGTVSSCGKETVSCFNVEKNIIECVGLKTLCDEYPNKVICENHKNIDEEILQNLCRFYDVSNRPVPFDCGSDVYISKDMVCDGNADCPNGLDEAYALCSNIQCEFMCTNSQCTLNKYLCDGISQCTDGDDEISCRNVTNACVTENEFECQTDASCINKTQVCDSVRDCLDGSDEWPSLCLSRDCEGKFRCEWNGACIENTKICDGVIDCSDSSDEKNCLFETVQADDSFYCTFKCNNGTCLHEQQLCDRFDDCEEGEDEQMCNYTLCSKSLHLCGKDLNSLCKVKPYFNYSCECKSGFQYDEVTKTCLDINECELGRCTNRCINTHGSYLCECDDGLMLKYGHCIENYNPNESSLLFSDQNRIFRLDLYANYSELLFQSDENVRMADFKISDFDYSFNKSLLFFSEYHSQSIYVYSYALKSKKLLYKPLDIVQFKVLLAYDWIHENLYFNLNTSIYAIGPANFGEQVSVQKIVANTFEVRSLVVSPSFKSLFWIDVAYETIESARLDGSGRRILVKNVMHAQALTIDHTVNRLYWLDVDNGFIATCDLNGNNYFLAVQHANNKLASITSFESSLFYLHDNRIKTISTDAGNKYRKFNDKLINRLIQTDNSNVIHFYSELSQPVSVVSPCNCGPCLCIPIGDTWTQDTKCLCKPINSISVANETTVLGEALKIVAVVTFVVCFLAISISFRIKPPRWLLKSIDNTKMQVYSIRFSRNKRYNVSEKMDCAASIHTNDSIIDLENEVEGS